MTRPTSSKPVSLGLDFGTESVRAILVDNTGRQLGLAESDFRHRQITETLPGTGARLPTGYALQAPGDWLDSASQATRQVLAESGISPGDVVGIGVDFTSCTMLPTTIDGTPLCQLDQWKDVALAWPKLWKHHGAIEQTDRMNAIARERNESFLKRYGGTIGLEWFFPKMLETIEMAPGVAEAADVWLEAGDWFVWQLVGCSANELTRSSCQAGYKAMWSASEGYPSQEYFAAVHSKLAEAAENRLPGVMRSPGEAAGQEASGFTDAAQAAIAMASAKPGESVLVSPRKDRSAAYHPLYQRYRDLCGRVSNEDSC